MYRKYKISKSSDESHSFEIIGISGRIIFRPDKCGDSVIVEDGVVMTRDRNGNPREVYKLRPGERAIII